MSAVVIRTNNNAVNVNANNTEPVYVDQITTGTVSVNTVTSVVKITQVAQQGVPGEGVATGGTTGQILAKASDDDYDTEWVNNAADGVQTVTGDGVGGTAADIVMTFPTVGDIGAYPDTNPSGFIDASGAPVQSVNGDTGNVEVYDGGNTSDILVKLSGTDYDTAWTDDITVDSISYDITAGIEPSAEGGTAWDADARTLAINKGGGVVQNITQDLNYPPARNTEATALVRGELVMVDPSQPAQGQTLRLKRYVSDGTLPVDLFVGMVAEAIAPNATGFVEWFGQLRNLSLPTLQPVGETWAEGDILWPNPAIAGGMTKVEPTAPAHKVTVAAILRINGNNINLLLRPNLRSRIVDLHDVQVTGASNSQVLTYQNGVWVNATNPADGVQSVTGDGVGGTAADIVMTFPTPAEIGAYSDSNPSSFVDSAGAASAAPVQSVNGNTGTVVIALDDIDDVNVAGVTDGQSLVYNATATEWQAVTIGGAVDSVNGQTGVVVLAATDVGAYSDTNPSNFIDSAGAPVQSVNGDTGVVVLNAADVGAYPDTNPSNFIDSAGAPLQSVTGDGVGGTSADVVLTFPTPADIGAYADTNPSGFIDSAGAPVQSVNSATGIVVLTASDVGAYADTNPSSFVDAAGAALAAPIQSITGDGVNNTDPANPVMSFPSVGDIGAYSDTNPSGFVDSAGASAAAPVQSVNGDTGVVVLTASDVGAYADTNPSAFVDAAGAASAAPVQSVNGDTGIVVLTAADVGAYADTNPSNFISASGAPVQSVNGDTGTVVLTAVDVGAYPDTNPSSFIDSAGAPVQSVNGDTGVVVLDASDVGALTALQTIDAKTENYTLLIGDAFKLLTMNNGSARTFTIPANGSVAYAIGTHIDFARLGDGDVTIGITSDTLRQPLGNKLRVKYSVATAIKIASTEWIVTGDLLP